MRNERPEADPLLFREIEYRNPTDLIISRLDALVSDGYLKPGDRLPAERALAERARRGWRMTSSSPSVNGSVSEVLRGGAASVDGLPARVGVRAEIENS